MTPYEMYQLNEKRGRIKWGSERPKKAKAKPKPARNPMTGMQIATYALVVYTAFLMFACAVFVCLALFYGTL